MAKERLVIICPGRGSYTRESSGYLNSKKNIADQEISWMNNQREATNLPTLNDLDSSTFKSKIHMIGVNASPLIYACSYVDFFSINTLTTGIYNAWIAFDDLAFANRISFFLLLFIFILFLTENLSRKKARYHLEAKGGFKKKEKIKLNGVKSFFAFIFCFTLFFLSFLFPLSQMLYWTIKFPENFIVAVKLAASFDLPP
mgnify:CR=1 FL=1